LLFAFDQNQPSMPFYQFTQIQKIPAPLDSVWDFISNPNNLKEITPPYLDFRVTSYHENNEMYAGMIITYIVRPLFGIPVKWMTEITHIKEKEYFVDEQRVGPYKLWHHQHKIEAIEQGVLMTDIVTYMPPFYFVGSIANRILIRKKLADIFHFRTRSLENKFGIFPAEYHNS
jgi:ligand-binding SRPBCC domain-containing protein